MTTNEQNHADQAIQTGHAAASQMVPAQPAPAANPAEWLSDPTAAAPSALAAEVAENAGTNSYDLLKQLTQTKRLGNQVPVAGWFHFPLADADPDEFIAETERSTAELRWDLVKIMTNGNYLPVAYGAGYRWSTDPESWDGPFSSHPIASAQNAAQLPVLDPTTGILDREVEVARRLVEHYRGRKPVLATLFDPISWVQELSTPLDPRYVLKLIEEDPAALEHALEAIQETNERFLERLIDAGVDGIFYSVKFSTSQLLTPEQHARFVLPYVKRTDDQLAGRTWLNMLHVHGDAGLYFDDLLPFDSFNALNWESEAPVEGAASIAELRAKTDKVLIAGIDQHRDFDGTATEVRERLSARLERALAQNDGGAFVFGPGCTLPLDRDSWLFGQIAEVAGRR